MANEKKAVGYVRCSTELQEDSPTQQKKEIESYANREGYQIIGWFEDSGFSGTTFEQRPAFQRLRKRVENSPDFKYVICYDESRWGRAISSEDNTYYRVLFRKQGVTVVLVKTAVDPKNEFAPMISAMESVQASSHSKKLSELTLRGSKNNGIYSNGGPAPFGYKRVAVNLKTGEERDLPPGAWAIRYQEKVKLALGEPEEISAVKFIFEERAKGKSLARITEALNLRGIACPNHGRSRNKDHAWCIVAVKGILTNEAYYGARRYNRISESKIQAQAKGVFVSPHIKRFQFKNEKKDLVITENAHPAIVSKELWDRVSTFNRDPHDRHHCKNVTRYLLSGLMKCSKCGYSFQGFSTKSKGHFYPSYADGGWQNKRVCRPFYIRQFEVEKFAISAIQRTLFDPSIINNIDEYLQELLKLQPQRKTEEITSLRKELQMTKNREKNIMIAIESGGEIDTLVGRLKELKQRINQLENSLFELEAQEINRIDPEIIRSGIKEFIENFEATFEKVPMDERKLLVKKCIKQIVVDTDNKVIRFYIRKLPLVSSDLEELQRDVSDEAIPGTSQIIPHLPDPKSWVPHKNNKALTEVVSAESSGGRT